MSELDHLDAVVGHCSAITDDEAMDWPMDNFDACSECGGSTIYRCGLCHEALCIQIPCVRSHACRCYNYSHALDSQADGHKDSTPDARTEYDAQDQLQISRMDDEAAQGTSLPEGS